MRRRLLAGRTQHSGLGRGEYTAERPRATPEHQATIGEFAQRNYLPEGTIRFSLQWLLSYRGMATIHVIWGHMTE